jgi:hypothetical protein
MEIIQYNKRADILVKFLEYGNIVHTDYKAFCKGQVRNVYEKSVCGIGYIGDGVYSPWVNGKETPQYRVWNNMIQRCYNLNHLVNSPTYKDSTVAEEWHNFQNFAKWCDENYYEVEEEKMQLDKDILKKGNKIYSPETCIFVPQLINTLLIKSNSIRGTLPIGVYWNKQSKKYRAACKKGSPKTSYIGLFDTPEEAFLSYKEHKERHIKDIAEKYKDKIPKKLYDVMMNYEVEITD